MRNKQNDYRNNRKPMDSDPLRAWEVYTMFGEADVRALSRYDQETIIRTYYSTIRNRPISKLSEEECYSIANRLLLKATEIISKLTPLEKAALKTKYKLSLATSSAELEQLIERLGIQSADLEENSPVLEVLGAN